ncbi:unnamed protein product [Didymodactylos carnosus]|nr:unnamed protein product [Didymodactylos carnosus]CAF4014364.1 unnamed protein product [Didymodactylos carnosus]
MLLLPVLKASKPARVVVVSSLANKRGGIVFDDINFEKSYEKWLAYGQSKTANILFAKRFSELYAKDGLVAHSLHPETIHKLHDPTGLGKHLTAEDHEMFKKLPAMEFKTVEQGAATTVWVALSHELDDKQGEYCEDCSISLGVTDQEQRYGMNPQCVDPESARRLWDLSVKMVDGIDDSSETAPSDTHTTA